MKKKHRTVVYNWKHGRLTFEEFFHESLEEALEFVKNLVCHDSKIYNEHGILVDAGRHSPPHHHEPHHFPHDDDGDDDDTYA